MAALFWYTVSMARYTHKFRASAVVMLQAEGYPGREGALTKISRQLNVPKSTLYRWYKREVDIPVAEIETQKKTMLEYIEAELIGIFGDLPDARLDASYRDIGTVMGILLDKRQLLTGGATKRVGFEDKKTQEALAKLGISEDDAAVEFERLVQAKAAEIDND